MCVKCQDCQNHTPVNMNIGICSARAMKVDGSLDMCDVELTRREILDKIIGASL